MQAVFTMSHSESIPEQKKAWMIWKTEILSQYQMIPQTKQEHFFFIKLIQIWDIAENPHNVEIVELEAAQVARVTGETAYVVLNGNYALEAGFSVGKDALAYEKSDSEAAKTYVNESQ